MVAVKLDQDRPARDLASSARGPRLFQWPNLSITTISRNSSISQAQGAYFLGVGNHGLTKLPEVFSTNIA